MGQCTSGCVHDGFVKAFGDPIHLRVVGYGCGVRGSNVVEKYLHGLAGIFFCIVRVELLCLMSVIVCHVH